jgi:hypothetical protein
MSPTLLTSNPASGAPTASACPQCEAPVVNVQGLLACRDCTWVDGPD